MSIVIASPGRLKGLFVAYPAFSLALIAAAGGFIVVGRRRGGRVAVASRRRAGHCRYVFSDSTQAFDAQGHLIPVPSYRKFELGTYIEYGLTNWLTLVAAPSYDRIQNPPPGQFYNGIIYLERRLACE
jgi:hypothetical protein